MADEVVKREQDEFEAFKAKLLDSDEDASLLDNVADVYDKFPVYLRALTNLDPTGPVGYVAQILSENRARREQENVLRALYLLYRWILKNADRITRLEEPYLQEQLPLLTERYIEESRKTLISQKIKRFRNIWANGILATERSFSEKSIVFDIIAELTEDEIVTLLYFWKRKDEPATHESNIVHISISEVAEGIGVDEVYAQQLCVRLRRHGLISDTTIGIIFGGTGPPTTFAIMDFTAIVMGYISDPSSD